MMSSSSAQCAVCGVAATFKCTACKLVYYCGKEHQKLHWKQHKAQCKCYEVAVSPLLGRHLRATRDIKCGEVLLREAPLIFGPKIASAPLCLGCHRKLSPPERLNYYKCRNCCWPLCGPECEQSPHHVDECALMTARNFRVKIDYNAANEQAKKKESAYCVILPLRCMLLKQKNRKQFELLASLEDHLQERVDTALYTVLRSNLVTFVRTVLGMSEWSEEDILRVAAMLDTNAFEVRQQAEGRRLRAVYPSAAMMSHDCVPNARHTFDDQMQIVFLAKTAIAKGQIIATSYTQPLKSTPMRRAHLSQAKCFECTCRRCQDPTELGTYAGAVLCIKCKVGKIVSTSPLDSAAVWRCQLCPHEITAKQINSGNAAVQKEIDSLDKTSPQQLEEFLVRYRDRLHESNTHVLQIKYALTQLYGSAPGCQMEELDDAAVGRKVALCQELLEVADLLDGGWSIFRGNLLLGLQDALVVQTKRALLKGSLSPEEAREKLLEAMKLLKESIDIMQFESDLRVVLNERTKQLAKDIKDIQTI